jgi:hypothetical protein
MKRSGSSIEHVDEGVEETFLCEYRQHIMDATEQLKKYLQQKLPETSVSEVTSLLESEDTEAIEQLLIKYSHQFREDPCYKIHQDVALIGHSLGGALAQDWTYGFTAHIGRMPLPDHQMLCYSSDGPAIDNFKDAEFMKFGKQNRLLFEALHVRWKIYHQFEYGDIVPEAGGSHLGTTNYHSQNDKRWMRNRPVVFRPLHGAQAISIVTPPTHGRRIGTAVAERDYTVTKITPQDLAQYDHSWWLSRRLGRIWGYRFFKSPCMSEIIRRKTGCVLTKVVRIAGLVMGQGWRNKHKQSVTEINSSSVPPNITV